MRFNGSIVFILLFLLYSFTGRAEKHEKREPQADKINDLLATANEYDLRNDIDGRDSLFDAALEYAALSSEDSQLVKIYSRYFENPEEYFTDRAVSYAKNLKQLANKQNDNSWHSYAYIASAKVNLYKNKVKEALDDAGQAFYYASLTVNPTLKVRTMLLMGSCLELSNKKVEAFKKYTDALYLSRKSDRDDLIFTCYQHLASFYSLIDNMEKAKEYKMAQFKMLQKEYEVDSVRFIKLSLNLAGFLFDNNEREPAEKITRHALEYSIRHNYTRFKVILFGTYRTYLINNGYFKELSELYTERYPEELDIISKRNPALYNRLKAFISEVNGQPDSSEYYYKLAEGQLSTGNRDNVYLSNFYKRYGEFLLRRGKLNEAEVKLQQAFVHAKDAQYLPYLTELTQELDSLYYSQGKTAEAYQFAKLNLQYSRQAELVHQEEELLKLEVENEARERELIAHREVEETERKHNIQYMGISIMIVVFFIILAMLGSFKVPAAVLKGLGFISFIFFFEFIIMLADHKIHHITHGEPVTFLAFKIVLIAILLPLHHWMEHKVVHYLSTHKLIDTSKISLKGFAKKVFKPNAQPVVQIPDEGSKEEPIEKH